MMAIWTTPVARLAMAGVTSGLMLWAFAYWWLGNSVHEVLGLLFCALVLRHVINNVFWWRRLGQGRWSSVRVVSVLLTVALGVCVLTLTGTSLFISRSLHAAVPLPDVFVLREVHWFSAFWLLALVGLHLGVNAGRIARAMSRVFGFDHIPQIAVVGLWGLALATAGQGIASGEVIGIWPRLMFGYSLSMWDFNASVLPYFAHLAAVVALFAVAGRMVVVVLTAGVDRRRAVRQN